ncbi:hypothetical protein EB077_12740 [bacterium]|nr:hypothetical protein [bacterium]
MATNFFFNNFSSSQEQNLIEDLVIESIKVYGIDVYYIPKRENKKDKIYGEDSLVEYNTNYLIDMYIKNVDGFGGDGDFLSKFNIEIRDQITFTLARRTFDLEIGAIEAFKRPQEGDLIFFPLNKKLFQIKFVEHEPVFYQMGSLQMYDLKCELFEYSDEVLNTGIADIDNIMFKYSSSLNIFAVLTEDGFELTDENGYTVVNEGFDLEVQDILSDNQDIEREADAILDFTEADPFSEGGNY